MPKIIGLTGGIGSGKSKVVSLFRSMGVPCYVADIEAKKLMATSEKLQKQLIDLLGEQAYEGGVLNRAYIAGIVFADADKLKALNQLVHPAVAEDFQAWLKIQTAPYVIKEVAILFENNGHLAVDKSLLITAPIELRIKRVVERDKSSKEAVIARMNNQWKDEQRIPLADYHFENIEWEETQQKVMELHQLFLNLS